MSANSSVPQIKFDNSYARDLVDLYVDWRPAGSPSPRLIRLNTGLAEELGLDAQAMDSPSGLDILAGNQVPPGAHPLAQAYAGHQFGHFSPQLGDGRALLLGEVIDTQGRRRDIAFKGSGRTPFSRGGDGLAALGPVLREYLLGEAMHALGIPTTRALAAVATGGQVMRDRLLPGAILCRVAASHLRVGTFEFFASRQDEEKLRRLADYAIRRHDPALIELPESERYAGLLDAVIRRQAALLAKWMGVGFIHGVMNTDNMTISGETIDYGPCAFMEHYDPQAVFSSIDKGGRYAYGNQPKIAQWNLARFAESLLPLIDADQDRAHERALALLHSFVPHYEREWRAVQQAKLGLTRQSEAELALVADFLALLKNHALDYTLAHRHLADAAAGDEAPLRQLFGAAESDLQAWLSRWQLLTQNSDAHARAQAMRRVNPFYIPRNHQVEAALTAAVEASDFAPFERLLQVLAQPFEERAEDAAYAEPAAASVTACYKTFCGT